MVQNKSVIAVALVMLLGAVGAQAYTGEALAKHAKVTMVEARAVALKAHAGKITDEELEKEAGGSGLRYSFDIRVGKVTQEVGVDAQTGALLENKAEGANPD
ncbi:PepSY domain-containing protein [Sulfuriferula thiophila]|uniref:PepSY domain-containing protein n=1 Tax=Sulfuriferula thiophila TaxID=1781211 RepID=UPI000F60AFB2|nr:PepSY domain-containing protein [Sulfuriferula thiophila]